MAIKYGIADASAPIGSVEYHNRAGWAFEALYRHIEDRAAQFVHAERNDHRDVIVRCGDELLALCAVAAELSDQAVEFREQFRRESGDYSQAQDEAEAEYHTLLNDLTHDIADLAVFRARDLANTPF